MFEKIVPSVLDKYGLNYATLYPSQAGYRNTCYKVLLADKSLVNVIFYKDEPGIVSTIARANELSQYAATTGLPTRKNISPRVLRLTAGKSIRYVSVYNYLPGHTIPWEAYTKKHVKLLGQAMSDLHFCLKTKPQNKLTSRKKVTDDLVELCRRMRRYFFDPNVRQAMKSKLGLALEDEHFTRFLPLLSLSERLTPAQPLHMDFVRGNLLFQKHNRPSASNLYIGDVGLSGILDFEKAATGHVVFDIARSLAFLLVDCNKYSGKKIAKYFLVSGYNKRGRNNFKRPIIVTETKNIDLLHELITFYLLHDLYKFLRHNPYEFLEQNHHFVRTRDILIARTMLEYSY